MLIRLPFRFPFLPVQSPLLTKDNPDDSILSRLLWEYSNRPRVQKDGFRFEQKVTDLVVSAAAWWCLVLVFAHTNFIAIVIVGVCASHCPRLSVSPIHVTK
jgi:hypothetical protein